MAEKKSVLRFKRWFNKFILFLLSLSNSSIDFCNYRRLLNKTKFYEGNVTLLSIIKRNAVSISNRANYVKLASLLDCCGQDHNLNFQSPYSAFEYPHNSECVNRQSPYILAFSWHPIKIGFLQSTPTLKFLSLTPIPFFKSN